MASDAAPVSRWCLAAFVFGLASFCFGILSLALWPNDYFRLCLLLAVLALMTAIVGVIETSRQQNRPRGYLLGLWGLCFPGVFYLFMLLRIGEEFRIWESPGSQTTNSLKQFGPALHNYHDIHKRLPPAAICDAAGKPLLSWRVAILPFVEAEDLYREFKLDEPWDSLHNIKLLQKMPGIYSIENRETAMPGMTFFQAFVGNGTPFEPGLICKIPGSFPDGTSNTLLVVEAANAVPWTKPEDLPYESEKPLPPLGTILPRGRMRVSDLLGFRPPQWHQAMVLLGDASVRRIDLKQISEETLRRAIVRNDGKELGPDW